MVVIKPTRDFTSEDRVSYAANNAAKPRQNTAINRYRQEISSGSLIPRNGKAAKQISNTRKSLQRNGTWHWPTITFRMPI